jgi:hypothetical protein
MNDMVIARESQWEGCYDDGWQGEIVPEAFAHPAKVSRALIRRIYQHAFVEGWLIPGDTVVDPFGGIAGTALDAMWSGLNWYGCELEPKFVGLAGENIDLWQRRYGSKPGFGSAVILQGDSRKLTGVIAGADVVCSSPPYVNDVVNERNGIDRSKMADGRPGGPNSQAGALGYGRQDGQLGAMREGAAPSLICSSPPYAAIATGAGGLNTKPGSTGQQTGRDASTASQSADQRYGESNGQLAVMREGEAPACIVSSPPFVQCRQDTTASAGGIASKRDGDVSIGLHYGQGERNGDSVGQLGSMPEGRFDAVVSSPPYEGQQVGTGADGRTGWRGYTDMGGGTGAKAEQLSAMVPDTFWQAAREIVAQCHQILRPGGNPAPDGDNIDFCDCGG